MIKRPTWIMVIVLALLAALAYYMQTVPDNFIKKAMEAGKTPTFAFVDKSLISVNDGLISIIAITAADGRSIILKREPAVWTIARDGQAATTADQSAAEQASSQAQALQLVTPEIKPTTSDLSGFGLDKPAYIYKITLDSGKIVNFKIGKETITANGYYLQKEDGTIAVVDKYGVDALLTLFTQPPSDLTATPSPIPVTEIPTGTMTLAPAVTATGTATPGK